MTRQRKRTVKRNRTFRRTAQPPLAATKRKRKTHQEVDKTSTKKKTNTKKVGLNKAIQRKARQVQDKIRHAQDGGHTQRGDEHNI
jgi:hypothetical protein